MGKYKNIELLSLIPQCRMNRYTVVGLSTNLLTHVNKQLFSNDILIKTALKVVNERTLKGLPKSASHLKTAS